MADDLCNLFDKIAIEPKKGAGAGGSNTNKNGLSYENKTSLESEYTLKIKNRYYEEIYFNQNKEKKYYFTKQGNLFQFLKNDINTLIDKAHGCKNPDECFIDNEQKYIFIIEKKFQQVGGSVCEKIQTAPFKLWQYQRTFPKYKIIYIYCLSDWFKNNCKAELDYLKLNNIPIFWGSDIEYKNNIVKFIINYE